MPRVSVQGSRLSISLDWGRYLLGIVGVLACLFTHRDAETASVMFSLGLGIAAGIGGMGCWGVARRSQGWVPPLLTLVLGLTVTQTVLVGYRVPEGLMPTPTDVLVQMWTGRSVLLKDMVQTVLWEALTGYGLGVGSGLVLGVAIARFKGLEQGLLPYLAALSSIPLPALAPVLVGSLGIEWPSKAAVVAVVVLFPMVINTVRGLQTVELPVLDLMRSYGATPTQVFWQVRLPQALPSLFNGLKVAVTLAMIAAIVGEFFGAPGSGLGFRIKIEAGRFQFDLVWAAILYATAATTLAYLVLDRIERRQIFWHPSQRGQNP